MERFKDLRPLLAAGFGFFKYPIARRCRTLLACLGQPYLVFCRRQCCENTSQGSNKALTLLLQPVKCKAPNLTRFSLHKPRSDKIKEREGCRILCFR